MSNRGILIMVLVAASMAGTYGCNSGSSTSGGQVYFGPGSAPNSNSFAGQGSLTSGPGMFMTVAALTSPRGGHTTSLLRDGRVLVVGGEGDGSNPIGFGFGMHTEAEVYDPVNDTWTVVSTLSPTPNAGRLMDPTNAFPTGRSDHTATSLLSGQILICGGVGYDRNGVGGQPVFPEPLATSYVFDPGSNSFSAVANMPVPRFMHLSKLLVSGNVLLTVGYAQYQPATAATSLKSADVFNTATGVWRSVGGVAGGDVLTDGHTYGNAVSVGQDTLIINGFHVSNGTSSMTAQPFEVYGIVPGYFLPGAAGSGGAFSQRGEFFSEPNDNFTPGPTSGREQFPSGIILGGAVTISNGDVFFAGGEDLGPMLSARYVGALFTTELLDFNTRTFTPGPDMNSSGPVPMGATTAPLIPRTEVECVEIGQSADVLIVGGLTPDAMGNPVGNPISEVWGSTFNLMLGTVNLMVPRQDHGAVALDQSRILVVGGFDEMFNPLDSVELWQR